MKRIEKYAPAGFIVVGSLLAIASYLNIHIPEACYWGAGVLTVTYFGISCFRAGSFN